MPARLDLGKYVMFDAIASGGMASVHFGRVRGPAGFARTVAIKRLHRELARDRELSEAFAAEARLAAKIRHPNVVSVLDVVETESDGLPELYLVMDFATAVPLSTLVARARELGRRIPVAVAAAIVSGLLRGLEAAHAIGVVHRDVSPENVLVGADGVAQIVDFGIAKIETQATRGTRLLGKPSYMAPEQLRDAGDPTDRRVDVYAASVVLWELLAGARLFSGPNDHAITLKVLERDVDAPSRVAPGLPAELDAVTLKGLSRDPAERFASAREMADALESAATIASAAEVGRFVDELCRDRLERLAERARSLELEDAPSDVEPAEVKPAGKARARRALGIALAGGALLIAALALALGGGNRAREAAPASAEPPSVSAPAASDAPSSAPAAPAPSAAPSRAEPPEPSKPPARPRPAASARRPDPRDCDPPYVIDSEGFQRLKPECL